MKSSEWSGRTLGFCVPLLAVSCGTEAPPARSPIAVEIPPPLEMVSDAPAIVPNIARAPAPQKAKLEAGDVFRGTYSCAQGQTDLRLRFTSVSPAKVEAVFEFAHRPSGAKGSFRVKGEFRPEDGTLLLAPTQWIEQPINYVSVPLSGKVDGDRLDGTISDPNCGAFFTSREVGSDRRDFP